MLRTVGWFALTGIVIFLIIFVLFELFKLNLDVNYIVMMLCPSAILMMATYGLTFADLAYWKVIGYTLAGNAIIYAIIGSLVWLGLNKSRWILAVVFLLVGAYWAYVVFPYIAVYF